MREIDQKLHVRAVLVGTVRKVENRLRVAVQLNNAENGYHLWSGSYERDSANFGTIAAGNRQCRHQCAGRRDLCAEAPQNLMQMPSHRIAARTKNYLKGLYFRNRYNVDGLNKAIEYFKQAIAEDPSFARAYAGLADCYAMARPVFATPPFEVVSKIKSAASKALELDGTLGEPHIDLAVSAEYEFDWATAEKEFKKGLELSPGDAVGTSLVRLVSGAVGPQGRSADAANHCGEAGSGFAFCGGIARRLLFRSRPLRRCGRAISQRSGAGTKFRTGASRPRRDVPGLKESVETRSRNYDWPMSRCRAHGGWPIWGMGMLSAGIPRRRSGY